ncbi:tbc domain containing protein [Entamoeba histolytica]|uniref:TBC domain containing protein n=3 Tax=Entamoeba histolytica TaxID=5759 RepID=C4LYU1_ENTH1|nr:TBC domain containing protein [Entamoeba histolytica HM-1:IMSS]EAL44680.1 TBC domain containing protein [Entamoeba histolytica HM-1:IMSS]EMD44352.1 TBC domain containing protein [Entamoeba histolytica KU27]GAT94006.1 tbc domain containing protein [Entamoeba histolytica]|eukprot:XP_650066.1 TBC domain containing protein [Entamoeba histolytica HM-1:IMSS]
MGDTPSKPEDTPSSFEQQPDYSKYTAQQVFDDWEEIEMKAPAFIRRFVKSIDNKTRLRYWLTMANPEQYTIKNPDLFQSLCAQAEVRMINDEEFKKIGQKIDLDVNRTFPNDPQMTEDKRLDLRDILRSFAILLPKTGYCQGMSFLAGQILLVTQNPEDTLWIFTYFMKDLNLYGLFCDGLPLLKFAVFCIEWVIKHRVPSLTKYFQEKDTPLLLVVGQWLTALFSINFDKCVTLKIWDMFLLEGFVWLVKVSSALLLIHGDLFNGLIDEVVIQLRQATLKDEWRNVSMTADGIVFGEKELKECKLAYDQSQQ